MRLLGRRVLLTPDPPQAEERRGHIWIPDRARSKPQEATVSAIGPEVTTLRVGDRVLFGKFSVIHAAEIFENADSIALVIVFIDVGCRTAQHSLFDFFEK